MEFVIKSQRIKTDGDFSIVYMRWW